MNLALFDFDGTITNIDTFTAFIHFAAGRKRKFWGRIILAPIIIAYKTGLLSAAKTREIVAGFAFKKRSVSDLSLRGDQYANEFISSHLRKIAMDRIQWHKDRDDHIVVVSASLDVYMNSWCKTHGLDLICSKFEEQNGFITGRYNPTDCSGEEKARRVQKEYDLAKFDTIFAYGDTSEDLAMLDLADIKFYRWKQI